MCVWMGDVYVKEQMWLPNIKYLYLSLNTSEALAFCIDTHVSMILNVNGIN